MITRDEWDKLTEDEKWAKYTADYYNGFSLSDINWKQPPPPEPKPAQHPPGWTQI